MRGNKDITSKTFNNEKTADKIVAYVNDTTSNKRPEVVQNKVKLVI